MFKAAHPPAASGLGRAAPQTPDPRVRQTVLKMLEKSEAYQALAPAARAEFAQNLTRVADFLARPMGIEGNRIPGGLGMTARPLSDDNQNLAAPEATFDDRMEAVRDIGDTPFRAEAAREGAAVAGLLLDEVSFPEFVGGLIQGVFQSIVTSSMEQMEQYGKLIQSVSQSLESFMDDNVSENQGRDHMVDKFPDLFEIGTDDWGGFGDEAATPKLKLREGVDESEALRRVNNSITFENGELKSLDLSDEQVEKALVHNARIQLAKQRQQMMASLILMGINRIVVTDGRISAKIMYDFRAVDAQRTRRSASAMDYARDAEGNVQMARSGEGSYESGRDVSYEGGESKGRGRRRSSKGPSYDASYYTKGEYKFENKPIITAKASAMSGSESQIQTKVQLAGNVSVNFKSDYLPLEKMATPGMIAAIQGNSTPVDPNVLPSARQAPAAAPGTAPQAPQPGALPAPGT